MNRYICTVAALTLAACSPQGGDKVPEKQAAAAQRPSDNEAEAYMWKAEEDWAAQAVRPVPGLMERILADDYSGVSSKGDIRTKADQIKDQAEPPSGTYVSSKLDYVHYRHFGDTVIAQGQESLKRADGKPDLQLIWNDIWMFRDGKWQIVASQDSVLPGENCRAQLSDCKAIGKQRAETIFARPTPERSEW